MLASLIGLAIVVSGCFGGPGLFSQDTSGSSASSEVAASVISDDGVVVTAAVDTSATLTQTLSAGSASNINGSTVSFPPGALSLPTQVTIEEGSSIVSGASINELGIPSSTEAASSAVVVSSSESLDASQPFTIQIPVNAASGLVSDFNLSLIFVIFIVEKVADGTTAIGIIPNSQITFVGGIARFPTRYFGVFQLGVAEEAVVETEATTEQEIVTAQEAANPPAAVALSEVAAVTNETTLEVTVTSAEATEYKFAVQQITSCADATYSDWVAISTPIQSELGADGSYLLCVVGRSSSGLEQESPSSTGFTLDATAPTVEAGTSTIATGSFTQDATVTGATSFSWIQTAGPGTVTFGSATTEDTTITATVDGTYTIQLSATDDVGNAASDSVTFTWDVTGPVPVDDVSVTAGTFMGQLDVSIDLPAITTDLNEIKVFRSASSVSPGVAAPACGSGDEVFSTQSFASDPTSFTDQTYEPGRYFSYTVCTYDASGNVNSLSNTDTISTTEPTLAFHYDASDIDGDGVFNVGSIDSNTSTVWNDRSGNNNHGTLNNWVFDVDGWRGDGSVSDPYRLKFDANNDYVFVGSSTTVLTYAIWFYADSMASGGGGESQIYHISGSHRLYAANHSVVSYSGGAFLGSGAQTGRWHQVTIVFTGATKEIYLNGVLVGSEAASLPGATSIAIGGTSIGSDVWDGDIADFRAYSVSLSDAQVKYLYEYTRPRFYNSPTGWSVERFTGLVSSTAGGSTLEAIGWNLKDINTFTVNGTSLSTITSAMSSRVNGTTPANAAGLYDVVIGDATGTATVSNVYRSATSNLSNLEAFFDPGNVDSKGNGGTGTTSDTWASLSGGHVASVIGGNNRWIGDGSGASPYSIDFDGTDDEIVVGRIKVRAMSIWFKVDTIVGVSYLFYGREPSSDTTYAYFSGANLSVRYDNVTSTTIAVSTGTWYHLAVTHDGSNADIYLDGSLLDTFPTSQPDPMWFMLGSVFQSNFFDGSLGEVRLYSEPISAGDVAAIYTETSPTYP